MNVTDFDLSYIEGYSGGLVQARGYGTECEAVEQGSIDPFVSIFVASRVGTVNERAMSVDLSVRDAQLLIDQLNRAIRHASA